MAFSATQKYHEFLSAVTHYAADGIVAFAHDGKIILANKALTEIFGYEAGELDGANVSCLLERNALNSGILQYIHDQLVGGIDNIPPFTLSGLKKSGKKVPLEMAVGRAELSGGEIVYIANCRDISERLVIEGRLWRQAEIISQMHDGIVVTDKDFRITECNAAISLMAAIRHEKVIGEDITKIFDVAFPHGVGPADIREAVLSKGKWNDIVGLTNCRKKHFKADVVVFPMLDAHVSDISLAFVVRDVTARLETENRLVQTQKIEALGRLAGGVAHDVNNLLFPIFLNLEAALEEIEPYDDLKQVGEDIQESMDACMKIKTMIQQILHFSRQNAIETEELDISGGISDAWSLAKMIVPSSIEQKVNIEPNCGTITVNSVQLSQLLLNLVSNAVAAMNDQNGTLQVSLKRVNRREINKPKYYDLQHDELAVLSVSDSGKGIAIKHRRNIFDPFFTTKEVGQGTGLGLTEVAGIVQSLKGAIDLSSTVGEGTTFQIYLPVCCDQAASIHA